MAYAIKDACNVTFFKRLADGSRKPFLYTDYANSSALNLTAQEVFARAKGVKKIGFNYEKEGTFRIECEVFSLDLLILNLGEEFEEILKDHYVRESLVVGADNTVTLKGEPVDGAFTVYKLSPNLKDHDEEIADGVLSGSDLTLEGVDEGTPVAVFYPKATTKGKTIAVDTHHFPGNVAIIGDTYAKNDVTGEDEFLQIDIPNCKAKFGLSLELDASNVATLTAEFDLFGDEHNKMVYLSLIEE